MPVISSPGAAALRNQRSSNWSLAGHSYVTFCRSSGETRSASKRPAAFWTRSLPRGSEPPTQYHCVHNAVMEGGMSTVSVLATLFVVLVLVNVISAMRTW